MAVRLRRRAAMATAAGIALGLVIPAGPPAHAAREESAVYAGTVEPVVSSLATWATGLSADGVCLPEQDGTGISQACFAVQPGDSEVRVRIDDAVSPLPRGALLFVDGNGEVIDGVAFCRRVRADVPDGAVAITVRVEPYACPPATSILPAGGEIVAYFE